MFQSFCEIVGVNRMRQMIQDSNVLSIQPLIKEKEKKFDYWDWDHNKLIEKDAREVTFQIPENTIDLKYESLTQNSGFIQSNTKARSQNKI